MHFFLIFFHSSLKYRNLLNSLREGTACAYFICPSSMGEEHPAPSLDPAQ